MKSLKLWLWACAVSLVVGCGGVPAETTVDEGDALTSASEALVGCYASCSDGTTVTCPTTPVTCTSTNYVSVVCDGTTYACPPTGCRPGMPTCSFARTKICLDLSTFSCCDDGEVGECTCRQVGGNPRCL
ncbi:MULTISPECIES: hypothetical protein [unclassified Myxococcus]|uniref:hypothetical protein n=1 Tax=unclassified Myxococcus TaxID=2648731 RepID=UPI001CC08670|nr:MULTISPECIES: hypothetical protein [unclassified Myxococcus]MBZ4397616.1 hypothetical protein [Myxococcus sp. AS-1-15]MBZ4407816.1 hypothetical protein [Myxococcus sp. XM-1-1-1]BDT31666.1 hypothetical protein MFMH1_13350 [Myxococcus sp. MH1]